MVQPPVLATIVVAGALVLGGGAATALAIGSAVAAETPTGVAPILVSPNAGEGNETPAPASTEGPEIVDPSDPHDLGDDKGDDSGADDSGADDSGSHGSGSDDSGSDDSGSDDSGSHDSGSDGSDDGGSSGSGSGSGESGSSDD